MRALRTGALVAVGMLLGALAIGIPYGASDGLLALVMLAAVALVGLGGAHVLVARRHRLGRLRGQLAASSAVALAALLVAVGLAGGVMFVAVHDAVVVAVLAAFGALVALRGARLLSRELLAELDAIRGSVAGVGAGARVVDLPVEGHDELAELAASVNTTVAALAAAERARAEVIAAVSHDLRTPITSLGLLVQAVDDDIVDAATRRRYVAQMGTHVRALSGLIDDLFELSRLEAGEVGWTLGRVGLAELVDETVEALRLPAERRGVRMGGAVDPDLFAEPANPEKLQRVLVNLLDNAIRHTPADGEVTVSAARRAGQLEIEVANTGAPIDPADRSRIFEPFFRGGSEAARTRSGAGLGLAVSRAIVEAHGGRIWLADPAVRGTPRTAVRFTLPAAG